MSLIDDLKKKAREAKDVGNKGTDITQRKRALFAPIIQPRLIYVQKFFNELSDTLNEIESEDQHEFKLTNSVTLNGFVKRNFSCYVKKDEKQELEETVFKYELLRKHDFNIPTQNSSESDLLKKILTDRNINFQNRSGDRSKSTFTIKPKINCGFTFKPDYETGMLALNIVNYDGTWDQTMKFRPDKVNDELLDEIGKYALHQENNLMEMTGNRMSITMRERLKQKLQFRTKKKKVRKKKRVKAGKQKKSSSLMGLLKRNPDKT